MSKKKHIANKQTIIKVGNISKISGEVNIAGGNITTNKTTKGLSPAKIKQLFDHLYTAIDINANVPPTDKENLKVNVREIQATVTEATQKKKEVDESFLSGRFRNIARMSSDILDVVVATLGNPLAGLGVTVKKIAEKAKAETG